MSTEQQPETPPRVAFGARFAARITARLEPILHPLLGLAAMVGLFAIALGSGKGLMAVEQGTIGDFIPGHVYASKAVYLALALIVVLFSRQVPRYREEFNAATGLAFHSYVLGWQATGSMLAWLLLAHYVLKRTNQYLALVIVGVGIAASAKVVAPGLMLGSGFYFALTGARVAYYAFDRRHLRKSHVSLMRGLSYAFTMLLFMGPDLVAYPSYYQDQPRAKMDRSAARLFYWAGVKVVLLALLIRFQHLILPDPIKYDQLSLAYKIFVVFNSHIAGLWLRVSVQFDVCAALANLAGYAVADPNEAPFLAETPLEFFRRNNVNVLNFYRRVVILETARRFRGSLAMAIVAGMTMNWLHHGFIYTVGSPNRSFVETMIMVAPLDSIVFLFVAIEMEKAYKKYRPLARFLFVPVNIFAGAIAVFNPGMNWFSYGKLGKAVTQAKLDCLMLSTFSGARCADATQPGPWYLWILVPTLLIGAITLFVVILGRLVPAFRAPVSDRPARPSSL